MNSKIQNIGWSIGNYCNAKCTHCYSWKQRKNKSDFLSREEIDIIVSKLIKYNVTTVNFGGNEPIFTNGSNLKQTMLPYIIDNLTANGIICGITTNGFTAKYLHDNYFETFMSVNDWDFSLDSPCKELHDKNRNSEGLFSGIIEGIELCQKYNRPRSIVVAGMNWNTDQESLQGFLEITRKYDTEFRINLMKPTEQEHFKLYPDTIQAYNIFDFLFKNTELITLSEPVLACLAGMDTEGCPCGTHSLRIRSKTNGRVPVTPCVYLDLDAGNILIQELDEIISSENFQKFVRRKINLPKKCKEIDCKLRDNCRGGCAARTYLVTGGFDNPDPYCPYLIDKTYIANMAVPKVADEQVGEKKIRVHENYLCTWIGKANKKKNEDIIEIY